MTAKKHRVYKVIKRAGDFTFSLVGLILSSPILLIVAVCIKISSHGPILFRQVRTGKDGKEFTIYKFRSMTTDNDVNNLEEEDRVTKIGKFIRATSIDELPQLYNVLKGDMSIVGPRPWIPVYYAKMNKKQRERCSVLPGVTGLAQVKGRNNISITKKIDYDLEYIDKLSLLEDIKIIILTIKALFTKDETENRKITLKEELQELEGRKKK